MSFPKPTESWGVRKVHSTCFSFWQSITNKSSLDTWIQKITQFNPEDSCRFLFEQKYGPDKKLSKSKRVLLGNSIEKEQTKSVMFRHFEIVIISFQKLGFAWSASLQNRTENDTTKQRPTLHQHSIKTPCVVQKSFFVVLEKLLIFSSALYRALTLTLVSVARQVMNKSAR